MFIPLLPLLLRWQIFLIVPVILSWVDDETNPQYERFVETYSLLSSETDTNGRNFEIIKIVHSIWQRVSLLGFPR